MKHRRHHNNKGHRQIKSGSSSRALARIARKLNIPFTGSSRGNEALIKTPPFPPVETPCEFCGQPNPSADHREICGVNHQHSNNP